MDCNSVKKMKNDKLMDALRVFELRNQEELKGGYYTVSYQSGNGVCDLRDSVTGIDLCNRKDSGAVGTTYK